MRTYIVLLLFFTLGCSHNSKCGNPKDARVIYSNKKSCEMRIRQVTIGSDLKIPSSLKNPSLTKLHLEWSDPGLVDGKVVMGHFVLVPSPSSEGTR